MKRRNLLISSGVVAGTAGLAWWQRNALARSIITSRKNEGVEVAAAPTLDDMCILTPEQVEGPFFIKAPVRSDVREDRSGLSLELNMQVVKANTCQPVKGAIVEIWHCDAAGRYSGYPEHLSRKPADTMLFLGPGDPNENVPAVNGKTYLRGAQASDADGMLSFSTIVPGWYEPRVPHIHIKVFIGERSYLTTQLYFTDEFLNDIYTRHPDYVPHGTSPYHYNNDLVLGGNPNGNGLLLKPEKKGEGFDASFKLGIS